MTAERIEADSHRKPRDPTAARSNGNSDVKSRDFVRRAGAIISELPSNVDAQMKSSPYTTLAIAVAVGVGAGALLGSRVLRSIVVTAASYAAVELGRLYLRQALAGSRRVET